MLTERSESLHAQAAGVMPETSSLTKALYYVVGDAEPGLLARVVEPVAKLGHVPARVHASAEDGDGSRMTVDLRVAAVPQTSAERIENALRSIVGVYQVIAVYETA